MTESDIFFSDEIPNLVQDTYIGILEEWCDKNIKDKNIRKIYIKDYSVFPEMVMFETFFNNNYKKIDYPCDIFIRLPLFFEE